MNPHCRAAVGDNVPKVGNGCLSLALMQKKEAEAPPTLARRQRRFRIAIWRWSAILLPPVVRLRHRDLAGEGFFDPVRVLFDRLVAVEEIFEQR